MEKLFELLGYATPALYAGIAFSFFTWLDRELSNDAKAAFASLLHDSEHNAKMAHAILEAFDTVYTIPLFGWRAAMRSVLFTLAVSIVYSYERKLITGLDDFYDYWDLILTAFWVNVVTDYLSLFLVRAVLKRGGNLPILSAICGTLLAVSFVTLGHCLRVIVYEIAYLHDVSDFGMATIEQEFLGDLKAFFPYAIPALIVFAWIPLLAFGLGLLRLSGGMMPALKITQWLIKDGESHPLKAIGYISGTSVFVLTVFVQMLFPVSSESTGRMKDSTLYRVTPSEERRSAIDGASALFSQRRAPSDVG